MVSQELAPATTFANVLTDAVRGEGPHPQPAQVTTALLEAERQAKQQRYGVDAEALLGSWQLRFTAPNKPAYKAGQPVGKGFYWPAIAPGTIRFSRAENQGDALTIQNQLMLGPLKLQFSGPAKFLPKKNLLAFDFVRLQFFVGRWQLLTLPISGKTGNGEAFPTTRISQLPFFAFFAATERYIAARGRGGGLALWIHSGE
ncbi:MAG: hypothetical protein HC929_21680 [Leptolyngbyaceae cyanobacterium SM2_5_2]|nr:hypothetical protein [Leptolyngbyaceae cyanobacterium SM2_5_2]